MKTITTDELNSLRDKNEGLTLVNTLGPESFETTRIPGAVNVPLNDSDFVTRVEQQAGNKAKPVVVYCANQQCNSSEKAAEKLEAVGFTNVATREEPQLGRRKPGKSMRPNAANYDVVQFSEGQNVRRSSERRR